MVTLPLKRFESSGDEKAKMSSERPTESDSHHP